MKDRQNVVTRLTIKADFLNGSHIDTEIFLPTGVAEDLLCKIGKWKHEYTATLPTVEAYQAELKKQVKKLKK